MEEVKKKLRTTGPLKKIKRLQMLVTPTEVLQYNLLRYYERLERRDFIMSPNISHEFNTSWKVERARYSGFLKNRRIQELLAEETVEDIIFKIGKDLRYVAEKLPQGVLFVSFGMFSYGGTIGGSPGQRLFSDATGDFYESFYATGGADPERHGGSGTIPGAIEQVRDLLETWVSEKHHAILIDSYTVKSYVFKKEK